MNEHEPSHQEEQTVNSENFSADKSQWLDRDQIAKRLRHDPSDPNFIRHHEEFIPVIQAARVTSHLDALLIGKIKKASRGSE